MANNCVLLLTVVVVYCVGVITALSMPFTDPVQLQGRNLDIIGLNETDYQSFMGIPYAEPPLGRLRFANPVPKSLPDGRFMAVTGPQMCIQQNFLIANSPVLGSEDCLYLNVYRPHKRRYSRNTRLPVMVYIHGGAFFSGTMDPSIQGPKYFMETGQVILVLMQYRLSTLGFLATGDAASPGNFGLKDQVMAMQWVKDNIASFGGNPNLITIFGQSAGGASVHMHMVSPLARGLFDQVIAMSGSAVGPYNYPTPDPLALTRKHAKIVGVEDADSLGTTELVDRLREIPAEELTSSVADLKFFDVDSLTVYRLVLEPSGLEGAYLTQPPLKLLREGKFAKVPFMTGLVEVEGGVRAAAIITNQTTVDAFNSQVEELIPQLMELQLTGEELTNFTNQVIDRYLPGSHKLSPENDDSFIKLYTDRSFIYPLYKQLDIMMTVSNIPIYTYHFNYRGTYSYSMLFTQTVRDFGVVHCDDLIYLFHSPLLFPNGLAGMDLEVSRNLVDTYVSFAKRRRAPWERTRLSHNKIGPYKSLMGKEMKYYNDFELVKFWDQMKEF